MPKKIVRAVVGELLETGRKTAKASKQVASDIVKQGGKALVGQQDAGEVNEAGVKSLYGIDETGKSKSDQKPEKKPEDKKLKKMQKFMHLKESLLYYVTYLLPIVLF